MVITFGTRFCGRIATVNNQWIETKFFHILFIPLFPVGSMFVTQSGYQKRNGFDMGVNSKSVIAVYGRIASMLLGAWFLFWAYAAFSEPYLIGQVNPFIPLILGIVAVAACIYFYRSYGKANDNDIRLRTRVVKLTGFYALPNWFDTIDLLNMISALEAKFKQQYPETDWKDEIKNGTLTNGNALLVYGLALLNCVMYDTPENDELYAEADRLYTEKIGDQA